jgi:limonene-1,2-epoxide hydrolase
VEKKSLPSRAGASPQMNSPLMLIESFLQALTNADKDGRIVITRKGTVGTIIFGLKAIMS